MAEVPAKLKAVAPYLVRAQELAKTEPVISYYCRMYAAQQCIPHARDPDARTFVTKLFDTLEKEKKALEGNPLMDETEAAAHVESFAQGIFDAADKEDRAGAATNVTAKRYRAAQSLFELLTLFNSELPADIQEKKKYCKWRTVEILKAIKAGVPVPPPPEGDDPLAGLEGMDAGETDLPPPPSFAPGMPGAPSPASDFGGFGAPAAQPWAPPPAPAPAPTPMSWGAPAPAQPPPTSWGAPPAPAPAPAAFHPPAPAPAPAYHPPAPAPAPTWHAPPPAPAPAAQWPGAPPTSWGAPAPAPAAPMYHAPSPAPAPAAYTPPPLAPTDYRPNVKNKENAQKYARFAGSSINYDDIPTAIKNLKDALFELTGVRY